MDHAPSENVLFINPLNIGFKELFTSHYAFGSRDNRSLPMGILYLISELMKNQNIADIKVLDYNLFEHEGVTTLEECESFINRRLTELVPYNPRFVCVALMMAQSYDYFKLLVKCIKHVFNNCILICGGNLASGIVKTVLAQDDAVNYVICGEGEDALSKLISNITCDCDDEIIGVYSRANIGQLTSKPSKTLPVKDFSLDFKAYSYFDINMYAGNSKNNNKHLGIIATRGCPVGCTFCNAQAVHGKRIRWRSLDNIRDEIVFLYEKYGINVVILNDSILTPKARVLDLLKMVAELPYENIHFAIGNMSVNHTDFEILDAMKNARIYGILLAIESGTEEIQSRIKKNCNLKKAVELVDYARKIGIYTTCNYILGFPGETLEQMQKTIDFSYEVGADWSNYYIATPYPGSEMYDEFAEMGYFDDAPISLGIDYRIRTFDTDVIKADDLMELAYTANLKYNFINNRLISDGKLEHAERHFKGFIDRFDFHVFAYDALRRVYELTNQMDKAADMENKINDLMNTDERSKEFKKYFHLLDNKQ